MDDVLQGIAAVAVVVWCGALAAIPLLLALKPRWAHLDYDAVIWRRTVPDFRELVVDYFKPEVAAILAAFVVGMLQSGPSFLARVEQGAYNALATAALTCVFLFLWAYVNASWKVYEKAKNAPYEPDVAFAPEHRLGTVTLVVKNRRIKTGSFSAQLWLVSGGLIQPGNNATSLKWSDGSDSRVIVKGEEQILQVLRLQTVGEDRRSLQAFVCDGMQHGQALGLTGKGIGSDYFTASMTLHLHITDSEGTVRPVKIWVGATASRAQYADISTHLIREY